MRAQCSLPDGPNYRRDVFLSGLRASGYAIERRVSSPQPGDILVIWNRSARDEAEARRFEKFGASVLVVENGYLGKNWRGVKWFAMGLGHHAGAGDWPKGGAQRWDALNVELFDWRHGGSETIILAQRGIGEPGIASPRGWAQQVQARIGGRIRAHPGMNAPAVPLEEDLQNASSVVTWHSAAAIKALIMGIPVWCAFPRWVCAGAARPLEEFGGEPKRDDTARLEALRSMAWANWTAEEVASGEAFERFKTCAS